MVRIVSKSVLLISTDSGAMLSRGRSGIYDLRDLVDGS